MISDIEAHALSLGGVFIWTPWKTVLEHAAHVINRPLDYDEAIFVLEKYVRFELNPKYFPTPEEIQVFITHHRLTFQST
jgi:hypothetical protein